MKRPTAIRHLVEMAEVASERVAFRKGDRGWPLEELWVTGELLEPAEVVEDGSVVLVLDLPADELPWLALHPDGEWVCRQLGLGKRPFLWCYRPLAWPVWNHRNRRLVRYWTASAGVDDEVLEALRSGRLEGLPVVGPSPEALACQLAEELAVSRRHLRTVLEHYWDRGWRRAHGRDEESPEDHLWRAAVAVEEMVEALEELGSA